ncbi:OmpA family protein [Altererythrobacter sp. Root672]|uniref:OmpA family protein n=1 Tax=Altererythrobacter sp. Root672 TaxID=1736584 RepID=UPI0006F79668|nr:OmpA family protein [Altererythrobacter sp. Root672]KRA79765.1 cell envelope biogenesis protein OmpA [Altererythrobacter sp. Root672]
MRVLSKGSSVPILLAALAMPAWGGLSAQQGPTNSSDSITVVGTAPTDLTGLTEGPEIEGIISARTGERLQVTGADGANTAILVSEATQIRSSGGPLGLSSAKLGADSLLNGLPVTVQTVQWDGGLVASRVKFKKSNLATASMIRNGTAQRFGEHDTAIAENAAATEALRGRVGDIDQYNIRGTTNVYFDTGKWGLTDSAEADLCAAAAEANSMDNALLLVVGYTDAVGSEDYNQELSERRAGRVVNYLQQKCGWAPYRMLTPTGMAESDPLADNETPAGKAQNRRVAVNILVSKAVEGL